MKSKDSKEYEENAIQLVYKHFPQMAAEKIKPQGWEMTAGTPKSKAVEKTPVLALPQQKGAEADIFQRVFFFRRPFITPEGFELEEEIFITFDKDGCYRIITPK